MRERQGRGRGTAVVVMAKAPRAGDVKTRLVPHLSADDASGLARAMLRDVLVKVRAVSADPFLALLGDDHGLPAGALRGVRVEPQRGGDLGERMAAAAAARFGEGYAAVAIVGTDSPTFPGERLERAIVLAHQGRVAVGPTEDGGYYLIAGPRDLTALFVDLPWGTSGVLAGTRRRARSIGLRLEELPAWYDVDDAAGLGRLRRELAEGGAGHRARHTRRWLGRHPEEGGR